MPNIKFLCLNLWLREVCTDDDTNANDDTVAFHLSLNTSNVVNVL